MKKSRLHDLKPGWQYLLSLMLISIVSVIGYLTSDLFGYRVVALLLLMSVSLLSMFFGIAPVLFSAFCSALIWDYFFIPPRFTLQVGNTEDTLMLLMYFVISLVNTVLTNKIREAEKLVLQKEEKDKTIRLYNTLLNSLSHELRTPIATIISATDNLQADNKKLSDDIRKELMQEISDAALRLNQQVENLLNISRLESGIIRPRLDWCDMNELIYSVVNKFNDNPKKISIKVEVRENIPLVKLDFGLMETVLFNLINNAIQYTPEHSIISISSFLSTSVEGHFEESDKKLETITDSVQNSIVIVVSDNGPGFPPDETDRVFDKFYRMNTVRTGGTGLGLSIVKGFVEAHNGTVHLDNQFTGGARFTIEIPTQTSYINALKNE
ncbi:MAG: ATP-binding protein [Bacteroidia bacterium]|nr:ATP-binding protein [Bacteroidia bacterium]